MIAQPDLRPSASPLPAAADATVRRLPARDADALLGALIYNWSVQRIALTLALPAAQLRTTEGLVARLRKTHELARQPLSLTVLLADGTTEPGLTARIRFDEPLTPERIAGHLSRALPGLGIAVKRDTSDRTARSHFIAIKA